MTLGQGNAPVHDRLSEQAIPARAIHWEASESAQMRDLPGSSVLMLATGCRVGECLAIDWQEIDLDRAAVDVCWRLVRRTGVGLLRLASTKILMPLRGRSRADENAPPAPSPHTGTYFRLRQAQWRPANPVAELGRDDAQTPAPPHRAAEVQPAFPDSPGGWRDPSNVRRVWRHVSDNAG
jgi:integrase